jgi:hypothetical protein
MDGLLTKNWQKIVLQKQAVKLALPLPVTIKTGPVS